MREIPHEMIGECATWLSIVGQLFGVRMTQNLRPFAVTQGQFSILHHIVRKSGAAGLRVSDIAVAVEVGQPAVTKAIAKFENMKLVSLSTSASDKRSNLVHATPEAGVFLGQIYASLLPDLTAIFQGWSADRMAQFITDLQELGKNLDAGRNCQTIRE